MNIPLRGAVLTRENAHLNMLKVRSNYNPDMSVVVESGGMWFDTITYTEIVDATSPIFTAPTVIGEASINFVCLHRSGGIRIIEGTPSISPVPPEISVNYVPLAMIYLNEGDTNINQDIIYDIRPVFSSNIFTNTHQNLSGTTLSNCHSISSITGLQAALDTKVSTSTYTSGLAAKCDWDGTTSESFSLNKDSTGPVSDAYLTVERGGTDVHIRWNEIADQWEFTNNGSTWLSMASGSSVSVFNLTEVAPSDFTGTSSGDVLMVNGTTDGLMWGTPSGGGSSAFIGLTDVAAASMGNQDDFLIVVDDGGTDRIDFIDPITNEEKFPIGVFVEVVASQTDIDSTFPTPFLHQHVYCNNEHKVCIYDGVSAWWNPTGIPCTTSGA